MDTKETLPGFENGLRAGMTTTDMVRCRSLVEQTRVLIVEVMSGGDADDEDEDDDETATETETDTETETEGGRPRPLAYDIDEESMHLDAARIYENTIIQLNIRLGDPLGSEAPVDDTDMTNATCY